MTTNLCPGNRLRYNFKNRFDHDSVLNIGDEDECGQSRFVLQRDHKPAVKSMTNFALKRIQDMANHAGVSEIENLFREKKALPAILVVAQTTIVSRLPRTVILRCLTPGMPAIFRISFLQLVPFGSNSEADNERIDPSAMTMLDKLNKAIWL